MLYRCVGRARASVSVSSMSLVSLHHTPTYASWLNQVERWFGLLTDKKLRRGAHRSIQALEKDIRDWGGPGWWGGPPPPPCPLGICI
jgi:transposase